MKQEQAPDSTAKFNGLLAEWHRTAPCALPLADTSPLVCGAVPLCVSVLCACVCSWRRAATGGLVAVVVVVVVGQLC